MKNLNPVDAQKILTTLSVIPKDKDNKVYFLSGGFEQYVSLYPFTCQHKALLESLPPSASQSDR